MGDLAELCRAALARAEDGELAEAYAVESRRTEVKARRGEVESLSGSETRGVGVRVIREGRLGYAWAADPDPGEAADLLIAARAGAEHTTPDEANVLPDPVPAEAIPDLFRDGQASLGPERKVALALDLERVAVSSHPEVPKVEETIYGDAVNRVAIASTTGVAAEYSRTDC